MAAPIKSTPAPLEGGFGKVGLHLDLRIQVLPIQALRRVAREASEVGLNTLILEWEGSFPFQEHAVISNRYAYTRREVQGFIRDCTRWGLDVIPLQQCFGHLEYILQHQRYAHLRESETDLCQLCPSRIDDAITTFSEIFRDIASAHPSDYFHIGGDETYLLGHCPKCRARSQTHGKSHLYVEYFRRVAEEVIKLGKRPLLWVDMLLKHPEAAAQMPRECIFIDWNYGWSVDRFGDFQSLRSQPFEFWGAPAMRSSPDNHSSFSWATHLGNLRDYVPLARSMNFQGMILTSWSTSGVYGYEWESPGHALGLHPIRRVFPHLDLKILLAAFARAATSAEPLAIEDFLLSYAHRQFGLAPRDCRAFLSALQLADVSHSSGDLPAMLKNASASRRIFARLVPRRGGEEFARYGLLTDLLEHDLQFKILQSHIQSPAFTEARRRYFLRKVSALLAASEALSRRFEHVHRDELYLPELQEETAYRLKGISELHARLSRSGRRLGTNAASRPRALSSPHARPAQRPVLLSPNPQDMLIDSPAGNLLMAGSKTKELTSL
ncbi:hypothetical protein BH09VER1_BH09VER1_16940 [soil metagenome]